MAVQCTASLICAALQDDIVCGKSRNFQNEGKWVQQEGMEYPSSAPSIAAGSHKSVAVLSSHLYDNRHRKQEGAQLYTQSDVFLFIRAYCILLNNKQTVFYCLNINLIFKKIIFHSIIFL